MAGFHRCKGNYEEYRKRQKSLFEESIFRKYGEINNCIIANYFFTRFQTVTSKICWYLHCQQKSKRNEKQCGNVCKYTHIHVCTHVPTHTDGLGYKLEKMQLLS